MSEHLRTQTPSLSLDLNCIAERYNSLRQAFDGTAHICFAVKANNHSAVVRKLRGLGSGFDVASAGEIAILHTMGIPGHQIYFSNPIKSPEGIAYAHKAGVTRFAVDCLDEVAKIAQHAPGAKVYVRMTVPNEGSGWPLSKKFGVHPDEAVDIMIQAKKSGLVPVGVTFHVGSQCTKLDNWRHALRICDATWTKAIKRGIKTLSLLDMGGGFPVPYHAQEEAPTPREVATVVHEEINGRFPGLECLVLEPGRYLVAEAGVLHASVTAVTTRDGERMAYLDCGLFNGLMEAYEWGSGDPNKFWYPIDLRLKEGETRPDEVVSLMGPSCDSVDVIVRKLPFKQLRAGDVLDFRLAGAYTNSYKSYNSLEYPVVVDISQAEGRSLRLVRNG